MSRLMSKMFAFGLSVALGASASAGSGTFSLDGDAEVVSGGKKNQKVVLLESDVTEEEIYGAIDWTPRVKGKNRLELNELEQLSATYQVIAGGIGGGSPRFQISLDTNGDGTHDGNVFVYIGDPPNFSSGTTTSLASTGNLLADDDLRFDATQVGGTFYMTFEEVLEVAGDAEVLGVSFVVDGGWMFPTQAVVVSELRIDSDKLNAKQLEPRGKGRGRGKDD